MPKQHFNPLKSTDKTVSSKNNHWFFPPEKFKKAKRKSKKQKPGQFLMYQVAGKPHFTAKARRKIQMMEAAMDMDGR